MPEHWDRTARDAAELTRRLAPGSRYDLLAEGYVRLFADTDYAGALALFNQALELGEDVDVLNALATVQMRLGNVELSVGYRERALVLDPQNVSLLTQTASAGHHYLRNFNRKLELYERATQIDTSVLNYCTKANLQLQVDLNAQRARATLDSSPEPVEHCHEIDFFERRFQYLVDHYESGDWDPWGFNEENYIAEAYGILGNEEKAREALRLMWSPTTWTNQEGFHAIQQAGLGNRDSALVALENFRVFLARERGVTMTAYNTFAAMTYVALGKYEERFYDEMFEVLDNEAAGPGWMHRAWLLRPTFDPVRDDPRFEAVMEKLASWETGGR